MVYSGPVEAVTQGAETVEVKADVELAEALKGFDGATAINRENGFYEVTMVEGKKSHDLNKFLFEKGITASHLVTKKKSLEKQFLEILAESE